MTFSLVNGDWGAGMRRLRVCREEQVRGWLSVLGAAASKTIDLPSFIANSAVARFLAVMGIFAVRRYQGKPRHGF